MLKFVKKLKIIVPVILLFIIITFTMTYPLILKVNTHIPGFFSTDEPFGVLWDSWRIKYSIFHHLPLKHAFFIAYPFGLDMYSSGFVAILSTTISYFLSIFTSPVLYYNICVLLNFILTGTFVYILVFYLIKNRLSAILSGIIFAFCPYQFMRSWQHLGLTYNEFMPLALFGTIALREEYSKKNIIIFLASFFLLFSIEWSIMYFTGIAVATFIIYTLLYNWKEKIKEKSLIINDLMYIRRVSMLLVIVAVILLPQFLPIIINRLHPSMSGKASAFNLFHRPFEDLFSQSAKPLSYLFPATAHPLFGKFTEQFIGSPLYGISFTEHTLYLGWVPLLLAFFAFKRWRKRNKGQSPKSGDSPFVRENFYLGFFVFLAIVAWFFSQPPWWKIGPLKIYMPSFFMYKLLPMYRAYCRFGIVVMLAVAVLAGFGLKFILERFKTQKVKIAITSLFCALVLFEFWNWPPYKVIDVSNVPAVYYWLKEQPGDFAIAEYPLDAASPNEMYKFYQTKHEKKIINGTIPGTYANKVAQTITKLSSPNTAGILKWMGVKYALVHHDGYLQTELIEDREELDKIPQNKDLKYIKSFPSQDCPNKDIMCVQKTGPIDAYEVTALPVKPEIKGR